MLLVALFIHVLPLLAGLFLFALGLRLLLGRMFFSTIFLLIVHIIICNVVGDDKVSQITITVNIIFALSF